MRNLLFSAACVLILAAPGFADEKAKPNTLPPTEIAEGWIMLFDGETTFGWKTEGDVKVDRGLLLVSGANGGKVVSTAQFPVPLEILIEWKRTGNAIVGLGETGANNETDEWREMRITYVPEGIGFRSSTESRPVGGDWKSGIGSYGGLSSKRVAVVVEKGGTAAIRSVKVRLTDPTPLFAGKNLDGWKMNPADPKRTESKFEVTKDGELSVKNGPGDLVTEKEFDNFMLQAECKTLGEGLNSGFFLRCIPEQYQNGYEAQIQNSFLNGDRTKPKDFGTGAIYRRVPARKVVSNDKEWFTMTVVADGKHFATWVNGYQTVDWTDDRKENDNPRNGFRAAKGPISIQGHDPTTNLLFRNIRIAELVK